MLSKIIRILRQSAYFIFFLFIFILFIKAGFPNFLNVHVKNNFVRRVLDLPHGDCSSCHIVHSAPGAQLGMIAGNANLCMSCHNPVGAASGKPFTNADKAIPGVSGTSHAWNIPADNITYGANLPTNTEMVKRIVNDTIICSTCHDQHSQDYPPFLRASNAGDDLCKDCHSIRNVGIYSTNPAINRGSHPVGIVYDGEDSRFETSPTNPNILLIDSRIECSSCHKLHYAETGDGYLLRATNDDDLCISCHTYGSHQGMGCSVCHQPHNPNLANIYIVKDTVHTPNSGLIPVKFFAETGTNSFADGDEVYDGICEACHTTTKFHRNNSSGNHKHHAGNNCTSCHTHKDAFAVSCSSCHGFPPDGTTTPNRAGSHGTHYAPTAWGPDLNACEDCHLFSTSTHQNGTVEFADTQLLATTNACDNCHSSGGAFDGVNDPEYGAKSNWMNGVYSNGNLLPGKESWCAGCHDADRASSNPDGTGILAPDVAGDMATYGYYYSGHGKNLVIKCTNCHDPTTEHLDGEARTYVYDQTIANLDGEQYRAGYRLIRLNGLEPMRIPLNDTSISQSDTANFRLCLDCHDWNEISDTIPPFATNFNHSGPNAGYSYGYDIGADTNSHAVFHLDMQTHYGPQPFWDSDWDFNTTADQVTDIPEVNGYDSYITCVTCHDVHGGRAFGGNTEGNMMRDGRLQDREPGLKFTYLIEAPGGFPYVTSVGANKENSVGGIVRSGVDYRAGYNGTEPNAICGGCHGEQFPATDEYDATGTAGNSCSECHMLNASDGYFIEYFRTPSPLSCTLCHGQPPDGDTYPNLAGSHDTHFNGGNGPGITDCEVCHADPQTSTHLNTYVSFATGTDINGNGNIDLEETDVCNNCHSPGGSYDGVNDPVTGAKNNWDAGVYTGNDLTAGKEKWCATCHDENPANSRADGSGVPAPGIVGDENASYIYGRGYGYYKTGHGLSTEEFYPASGGVTAGAGLSCGACHDYSATHIDHIARTFDDGESSTTDPGVYRQGYRLNLVNDLEPMQIPLPKNTMPRNNINQYRLCYSCHDSGPFLNADNMNTNLIADERNYHQYHLNSNQLVYPADWDGIHTSRTTCIACHNVHGSTYMTMVRDGKLTNREPGNQIWYNNDTIVSYNTSNPDPPDPENLPLAASTGILWIPTSSGNLCANCHHFGNTLPEYRTPFQDVSTDPWLEWVGDFDFENDGVYPDTSYSGSPLLFRVNYFDYNNDTPTSHQVLVDIDGDGITDTLFLTPRPDDVNYTNGVVFSVSGEVFRPFAGPGNVDYRFDFVSTGVTAPGEPSLNHPFFMKNSLPVLDWTGNANFETDGVNPTIGPAGNFNFEILYKDADGDLPSDLNLVIDDNEPGYAMIADTGEITSGKVYKISVNLTDIKNYNYRFTAKDNDLWGGNAVQLPGPLTNHTFTVTGSSNHIPVLSYVSEGCFTNSAFPVRGPVNGDYDFRVVYTDLDNDAPSSINLIIDNTDTYILSAISGDITTGRVYGTTIQLSNAGSHTYHFTASDGQDPAIGDPSVVNGNSMEVVNAVKVKLNETRPGWYSSIQTAIDNYSDTIIMVYPGVYNENLSILYAGDDKLFLEAVCGPESTIIDAPGNTIFTQNIPGYTKIKGFTITGGTNGMYINNVKAEITDCIIRNNSDRGINSSNPGNSLTITNTVIRDNNELGANTNGFGAGISFNGGISHVISNCIITNNHATENGGGIFVQNIVTGTFLVTETTISGNSAIGYGGGICSNHSDLKVEKCKITFNTALSGGGGIYVNGPDRTIDLINSIVAENTSVDGSGFWFNSSSTSIVNSTFTENTTSDVVSGKGGAIYSSDGTPALINCIFWNNMAGSDAKTGHNCYAASYSTVFTFTYCDFINNNNTLSGIGTFNVDATSIGANPWFENATGGDYRLKSISPCIDFGTQTGAPADDIVGQARGVDGRGDGNVTGDLSDYDMGAYEFIR